MARRDVVSTAALVLVLIGYGLGMLAIGLFVALRPFSHQGAVSMGLAMIAMGLVDGLLQTVGFVLAIVGLARARRGQLPGRAVLVTLVLSLLGGGGAVLLVVFGTLAGMDFAR